MRRQGTFGCLDGALSQGADVLGGLDPCAIHRDPVAQLDGLFQLVEQHGRRLDLHLHSRVELGACELELVMERTRGMGLEWRVTIVHGFAPGDLPAARQRSLLAACGELAITWTTVAPPTGLPGS